jgi:Xaa-Pro aminopeptidase
MNRYSQVFLDVSGDVPAAEVYRSRRKSLLKTLESVAVMEGMVRDPGTEEVFASTWTRFVQDPAFLFLTGVNQAGCRLLLDPFAEREAEREVLFLPVTDANKEFWTGAKLSYSEERLPEMKKLTGFETILPAGEFFAYLDSLVKRRNLKLVEAFYLNFSSDGKSLSVSDDHNARFARALKERFENGLEIRSFAEKHFALRVVLDSFRIRDVRNAESVTGKAFVELLENLKNLKNEREAGLFLNYRMQLQSDGDLAFPTIVACGKNACCLHYVKNDEPLEAGKLLLLDFGIRIGTQHSDVSRTIPVGGKFSPMQKILYGIVLDAQKFHEKNVRPGAKIENLNALVWDFILRALEERFVSRGGKYRLLYEKRPHGVSHLIGEQIHEGDPFRLYAKRPLEPGMLISNEPGLYGHFEIEISGVRYEEDVGIRIENDLLVTEDGCEDLSRDIPREIDEIEKLLA